MAQIYSNNRNKTNPPAKGVRWIMSRRDLGNEVGPAVYMAIKSDSSKVIVKVKGRQRQVLDALMLGPIFCASPIRLSEYVARLKIDRNISIRTDWHGGADERYGTYTLLDGVEYIGEAVKKVTP